MSQAVWSPLAPICSDTIFQIKQVRGRKLKKNLYDTIFPNLCLVYSTTPLHSAKHSMNEIIHHVFIYFFLLHQRSRSRSMLHSRDILQHHHSSMQREENNLVMHCYIFVYLIPDDYKHQVQNNIILFIFQKGSHTHFVLQA